MFLSELCPPPRALEQKKIAGWPGTGRSRKVASVPQSARGRIPCGSPGRACILALCGPGAADRVARGRSCLRRLVAPPAPAKGQSFKVSKLQSFKVSKFQSFRVSKFQSFKVSKFQIFKFSKFQSVKVSKFQSFNVSKFQSFKVSPLLGSRVKDPARLSGVPLCAAGPPTPALAAYVQCFPQ